MKFALIGCGRISPNHLKAALNNGLTVSAVCDIIPAQMENTLATFQMQQDETVKRFTDYKEMLSETKPDLVAIATESGKHAAIALDCISGGCHVIIEKPIALSLEDADAIISKAKAAGVKVCACHQNRFNHSIQWIRGAMENGRFGKLSHGSVHVRWSRGEDYYTQAPWRGTWAQDGGVLMNQSIHAIDLLRWMMGDEIDEVFGYGVKRFHTHIECEDTGLAVIKFKNGAIGSLEGTTNVFPQNLEETLYLFGERGTVKAGGKSMNTIETWQFADHDPNDEMLIQGYHEQVANVYGNGHTPLYADMIQAIHDNREPYISADAGKRALELVLAVYLSVKTGMPVKLPLDRCATKDFGGMYHE